MPPILARSSAMSEPSTRSSITLSFKVSAVISPPLIIVLDEPLSMDTLPASISVLSPFIALNVNCEPFNEP